MFGGTSTAKASQPGFFGSVIEPATQGLGGTASKLKRPGMGVNQKNSSSAVKLTNNNNR